MLLHSQTLTAALQQSLDETHIVEFAMRYGKPTITSALNRLTEKNCEQLMVVPLYPQYAGATSESTIQAVKKVLNKQKIKIPVKFLKEFYFDSQYIEANATLIKNNLKDKPVDKIIFSYHGLPERHIHSVCKEKTACNLKTPCPKIENNNQACYRAQCYSTSHLIAEKLGLQKDDYIVAFQSRLGKTPWITPYTDHTLNQLAKENIKNIAIVCPSFVADCLETLEEIDIRGKQQWKTLGGREFIRIPCLNANPTWVSALANIIKGI